MVIKKNGLGIIVVHKNIYKQPGLTFFHDYELEFTNTMLVQEFYEPFETYQFVHRVPMVYLWR